MRQIDFTKPCTDIDVFVFGSDQIWNPDICQGYDKHYLADAEVFRGKKCIAYSASAGRVVNVESDKGQLLNRLSLFDRISVREISLLNWLKTNGIDKTVLALDPVLLAGNDGFESIIQKSKIRKPYLLLFLLVKLPIAIRVAKKVAERENLEIIELTPESFLRMIKDASYIDTTSFHATAFSILFKKNFTVVSTYDSLNERVQSLLSLFDLESRLCFNENNIDFSPIDYEREFNKFEAVKKDSENLLNSLE